MKYPDRPWWVILNLSPNADKREILEQYDNCLRELKAAKHAGMMENVKRERGIEYGRE